jgi:hypothetical protein
MKNLSGNGEVFLFVKNLGKNSNSGTTVFIYHQHVKPNSLIKTRELIITFASCESQSPF